MTDSSPSTATIATERLLLAPLVPADAKALQRITDDPAIISAISFLEAPFTLGAATALIALNGNGQDLFRGIRRREDNVLIGLIGSHDRGTGTVEIGYWIGTASQRQGYGTEAVTGLLGHLAAAMPPPRIIAECHPANRVSWRLLERVGFRGTGKPGVRPGRLELAWTG